MEKIVPQIQALSTGDENELKHLLTFLGKGEELMFKQLHLLDEVLSVLDPQLHSLGWLFILHVKAVANADPKLFVDQCVQFLRVCSPQQIRLDPKRFKFVCQRFTEYCVEGKQAIRAIQPLKWAILRVQPMVEHITPQHANMLMCCVISKCYKAGVNLLSQEVYEVDAKSTGVTPRDMLLYFYYGGICWIAVKDWEKAVYFFQQVISAPAVVPSQIMVEAYKKYVLVSLLATGIVGGVPRYTSPGLQRHLKQACPQYEEFNTSYSTKSTDDIHKCAETHMEIFRKDGNWGLIKQCIQSLYRRNIQRLTKTYLTLSTQNIADTVKLTHKQDAESRILHMIANKEIFASINQKDGMVSFHENPEQYDTNEMQTKLDKLIHQTMDLTTKLQRLDETIATSEKYVQKTMQTERGPHGRWGPDYDEMDGMISGNDRPGFHAGPGGFRG